MKRMNYIIACLLILCTNAVAQERISELRPIYTQADQYGHEYHIVKVTLKDGILTLWFMIENLTNDDAEYHTIDIGEVEYISEGRRFPVLKDGDRKWLVKPYGLYEIFYNSRQRHEMEPGWRRVAWIKMQAPEEHQWPIELYLPRMLPFIIEKPE